MGSSARKGGGEVETGLGVTPGRREREEEERREEDAGRGAPLA